MSAADTSNADGGGVGGKLRNKPFRRHQTTPYDRPPTALRISPQRNNGWLSRLVDPASKLITSSAHKLFASVFRKHLLPPPSPTPPPQRQPSDGNEERREIMLEAASTDHLRAEEKTVHDTRSLKASSDSNGLAELEQILRENNFARSELDRLNALLHSKSVSMPTDAGTETSDATPEKNHDNQSRHTEVTDGPVLKNGIVSNVLTGVTSTPGFRKNVVEENMASPVDLAKAYMASRSAKMSLSMSGLRSQVHREDPLFSGSSSHLRSPNISLAPKPSSSVSTYENTIVMSRSQGKSAIYSMPHLPYSRVHPTLRYKGNGPALVAGSSSSSLFQCSLEDSQFNERKKSALKRRSTALDNDIGSIGPIRRLRQKPNLLSPRTVISGASHAAQGSDIGAAGVASPMMRIMEDHSSLNSSAERINGKLNNPSSVYNPSRSIELGQKILQQLDKLSPKEKPKEQTLKIAAGRSPSELTADMLDGRAPRSLETVDSYKFIQHVQQNTNRTGALDVVSDVSNSKLKKEDRSNDNGLKGPGNPFVKLPPVSTAEAGLPVKASLSTSIAINAADRKIYDPPKKSGAFQISAHEEYLFMEDDVRSNGAMSASLSERKKDDSNVKSEVLTGEKKAVDVVIPPVLDEVVGLEKVPLFSAPESSLVSVADKIKEPDLASVADSVAEANNDFTFPAAPVSTPTFSFTGKTRVVIQTSGSGKEVAAPQLNTGASAFSLPRKSSDIMFPLLFSPPSFPTDSSGSKDTKPELSGSFASVTSTSVAVTTFPEHNKVHDKGHENAVNVSKMEETPSPSATGFAAGSFSFNVPVSSPIVGNGIIGSGSEAASAVSPVLFSDIGDKQRFSTPSTCAAAVPTVTASSAADSIKEASPIFVSGNSGLSIKSSTPPSSILKFEAKEHPPASDSRPSTSFDSESTQSALKLKGSGFGGQSSPSFSFSSSVTGNADAGFFGFKASTSTNDSGFGSQSSPCFSFPSCVASNADAGFFGLKASSSPNDSSFISSTAAFNRFASSSAMGSNSGGSSSITSSLSTTSMSSSSVNSGTLGGSSWQSSNPPVFNTTFSSSSTPMNLFGAAGSTSVSAASSAPMVFGTAGSSSSPAFSFAASSPVSRNPLSASQPFLGSTNSPFTFGLTSTNNNNDQMNMDDRMAEDSVQASPAAVPAFGQSPLATPSTGFVFGATTLPAANPFQFDSQPNHQTPAQSLSPYQPSGSMESNPGRFSLGASGNDKSARKIIKVRKPLRKR